MKNTICLATTLGLVAVLGGLVSVVPAQAQDWHKRLDVVDIRRDQARLDDLYAQRRHEVDRGDWRDVKRIDFKIAEVKRDIDRDRRELRFDHD